MAIGNGVKGTHKRTIIDAIRTSNPAQLNTFNALTPIEADEPTIFLRNAFNLAGYGHTSRNHGVFQIASRFNHSCVPNAFFTWNRMLNMNGNVGALTIHAILPIAAGEEISVSYQKVRGLPKARSSRNTPLVRDYCFLLRLPCLRCDCANRRY